MDNVINRFVAAAINKPNGANITMGLAVSRICEVLQSRAVIKTSALTTDESHWVEYRLFGKMSRCETNPKRESLHPKDKAFYTRNYEELNQVSKHLKALTGAK